MSMNKISQSKNTEMSATDSITYILKKKTHVGSKVLVTYKNEYIEGKINDCNLNNGFVTIDAATGQYFIALTDIVYVQLLCVDDKPCHHKNEIKNCHDDIKINIWSKIKVEDLVYTILNERLDRFGAEVNEINLLRRYVGLKTVSGITYIPIDNINSVHTIC